MRTWWIFEVINMFGISEGLHSSFARSSFEAQDQIENNLAYPAKEIRFFGTSFELYNDVPNNCTIV